MSFLHIHVQRNQWGHPFLINLHGQAAYLNFDPSIGLWRDPFDNTFAQGDQYLNFVVPVPAPFPQPQFYFPPQHHMTAAPTQHYLPQISAAPQTQVSQPPIQLNPPKDPAIISVKQSKTYDNPFVPGSKVIEITTIEVHPAPKQETPPLKPSSLDDSVVSNSPEPGEQKSSAPEFSSTTSSDIQPTISEQSTITNLTEDKTAEPQDDKPKNDELPAKTEIPHTHAEVISHHSRASGNPKKPAKTISTPAQAAAAKPAQPMPAQSALIKSTPINAPTAAATTALKKSKERKKDFDLFSSSTPTKTESTPATSAPKTQPNLQIENCHLEVEFVTPEKPKKKKSAAKEQPAKNPNEKIFDFNGVRVKGLVENSQLNTDHVTLTWSSAVKSYQGPVNFDGERFTPRNDTGTLSIGIKEYTGKLTENFEIPKDQEITVKKLGIIFKGAFDSNLELNGENGSVILDNEPDRTLTGKFEHGKLIGDAIITWSDKKVFTGTITQDYQPLKGTWIFPLDALPAQYAPSIGFSDTLKGIGDFNGDASWTGNMKGFANITLKGKSQQGLPTGKCSLEMQEFEGKSPIAQVILEPAGQPKTLILPNFGTFTFFEDGKTNLTYRNGDRYYGIVQNLLPNDPNGLHYIEAIKYFIIGNFSAQNPNKKGTIDSTQVARVYQSLPPNTPRSTELTAEDRTTLANFLSATHIDIDHCHLIYEGHIRNLDNSHYAYSHENQPGQLLLPNENNEWYLCEHAFFAGYPQQQATIKKFNSDISYTGAVSHGQIFGEGMFTNGAITLKGKFCLYQDDQVYEEIMIQEVTAWTGDESAKPKDGSLLKDCAPFQGFKPPAMVLVLKPTGTEQEATIIPTGQAVDGRSLEQALRAIALGQTIIFE